MVPALGIPKSIIVKYIVYVTLCCSTKVRLKCSTPPPQRPHCSTSKRGRAKSGTKNVTWIAMILVTLYCTWQVWQQLPTKEAYLLNKCSCLAPTNFTNVRDLILVALHSVASLSIFVKKMSTLVPPLYDLHLSFV